MAKATKGLTAKRVQAIKTPGKHHDSQGPVRGLHLQVGANGSKSWLLRYEVDGRERWMGLGSAGDFTLKEARERARAARQLLADGKDPIEERLAQRDAERKERQTNIVFRDALARFLSVHGDLWRSPKHRCQWETTVRQYAGVLLDRRVKDIDASAINEVLAAHWARIPDTTGRVRQRVERILKWTRSGMPMPKAAGNGTHHPALPYSELPAFMTELRKRDGIDARALELLILTAARTNEVLGATWDEFDLSKRLWTVPATRAKSAREHRVPLSDRAVAILRELPTERGNHFVLLVRVPVAGLVTIPCWSWPKVSEPV